MWVWICKETYQHNNNSASNLEIHSNLASWFSFKLLHMQMHKHLHWSFQCPDLSIFLLYRYGHHLPP